ncbi:MAG: hypothetical protein ACFCVH_06425 [Alphaproteobacteria bacterium]
MPEQRPSRRTEKLQLMLNDEELRTIDDWRFEHRIPTRAAAIRELLRRGLLSRDVGSPEENASTRDYGVVDAQGQDQASARGSNR